MLDALGKILLKAGEMVTGAANTRVFTKEGHVNYVTETDIAVEKYLLEALHALLPGSRSFAEEQENTALTDAPTWVVDPIDGTTNFMRNWNISTVSVALLKKKRPVLGLVLQPFTGELYRAEAGKGAFLNGRPIKVSSHSYEGAIVGLGTSPYNADLAAASMRAAGMFLKNGDLRRTGTAALDLAYVAAGRMDIFFEYQLSPWDYAAGALLVTEAGGCFGSLTDTVSYERKSTVLAASPQCYRQAQAVLNEAWRSL